MLAVMSKLGEVVYVLDTDDMTCEPCTVEDVKNLVANGYEVRGGSKMGATPIGLMAIRSFLRGGDAEKAFKYHIAYSRVKGEVPVVEYMLSQKKGVCITAVNGSIIRVYLEDLSYKGTHIEIRKQLLCEVAVSEFTKSFYNSLISEHLAAGYNTEGIIIDYIYDGNTKLVYV